MIRPDCGFDLGGGTVAEPDPDNLGWVPGNRAAITEVHVSRDDHKIIITGEVPKGSIGLPIKADRLHMLRPLEDVRQHRHETGR